MVAPTELVADMVTSTHHRAQALSPVQAGRRVWRIWCLSGDKLPSFAREFAEFAGSEKKSALEKSYPREIEPRMGRLSCWGFVLACLVYSTSAELPANVTVHRHQNRIARHEARQRAAQSELNTQAYRSSQAAAVLANTADLAGVSQSKEHWTGRNSTALDPGASMIISSLSVCLLCSSPYSLC